jgi:Fur family transcriptional regulator, ferric uptake regulator
MTASFARPPLAAATTTAAVGALRARGLRVSAARRLVLEALYASDGPVSADDIAGGLDGRLPPSDLASVYRNLDTLETVGLVQHVHLGHGPGLYALTGRHRGWAVCESCGSCGSLSRSAADEVRDAVERATGFEAHFSHFPIVGVCAACRLQGAHHAHP